jgi:predicted ATP-binding protein involved in virulence
MRIDQLIVKNFKGFKHREFQLHPEFNLIVGVNGTGKTSLLDALSVAVGSWFLGFSGCDTRHIRQSEATLVHFGEKGWEPQYPCTVEAAGEVAGKTLSWVRSLNTPGGRTTYGEARNIKDLATLSHVKVRMGADDLLPLISYYGTGRLWNVPREQAQVKNEQKIARKENLSRLEGYRNSVDPRLSVSELVRWIARQSWVSFQKGGQTKPLFDTVQKAIISCIDNATHIGFDADLGEIIAEIEGQEKQPFNNLSDGQRCMLAMVGDIAEKAATLNPHLGEKVLEETSGVVLIDELDLHLHPIWQRRVIEDLRRTFPRIQFFATTHSPFLIQSLRSGEELVLLEGQPTAQLGNKTLEEIARGIMGVTNPQVSLRYEEMKDTAKNYLELLEEAAMAPEKKLEAYKAKLAEAIAPYADNPAFQAFLEMKHAAKLGE